MGGLSFCFSNEPCIRKGVKREWETGRRPAYQAGFAPFLIWGECPTARGHRPRAARRPSASSHPPPAKTPAASGQSPQSRSREASQPVNRHPTGRAPPSSGTAAPTLLFSSRPENPCGKRAKPAKPQPGGQQPGRHSRSREATAPATPPPQSVPSYPEPSEPARQSFHPDSSHASGSRSDSAWSQDASPRK